MKILCVRKIAFSDCLESMTITQPHTPHTQLLSVNVWMCCVLCYLATANCYCYSISNRRQGQWNAIRIYRFRLAGRTVSHIDNFLVRKSLFTCTFPVFRALTNTHDESMAGVVPRLPCYLSIEMNICIFKFTELWTCICGRNVCRSSITNHNSSDHWPFRQLPHRQWEIPFLRSLSTCQFYHTFTHMFTFAAINNQTKHLGSVNKRMGQWWNACVCARRATTGRMQFDKTEMKSKSCEVIKITSET